LVVKILAKPASIFDASNKTAAKHKTIPQFTAEIDRKLRDGFLTNKF
jgi:hypothetical protein